MESLIQRLTPTLLPLEEFEETKTLPLRCSTILGPYHSDMMLSVNKIGDVENGLVHHLCAPVISEYYTQRKATEINSLPGQFLIQKDKKYLLTTFISPVEYSVFSTVNNGNALSLKKFEVGLV